jgi:hypothetical protein
VSGVNRSVRAAQAVIHGIIGLYGQRDDCSAMIGSYGQLMAVVQGSD